MLNQSTNNILKHWQNTNIIQIIQKENNQNKMYIDQQVTHQSEQQCYMDCHTHLLDYPQQADIDNVILNSQKHGVRFIVVNTTTTKQFSYLNKLLQKYPNYIIPTFGIHPCFLETQQAIQDKKKHINQNLTQEQKNNETEHLSISWIEQLQKILKKKELYSIGEIGLDFRKDILEKNPKELQMHYFKTQLDMAIKLKRPATIHCVRAHGQMLKILKDINKNIKIEHKPNLIMHSYGGSLDITKSMLKLDNLNIYFSLCLKRSTDLCSVIPLQNLICETDSPCQNNTQLLQEQNTINFNKYYFKVKQLIKEGQEKNNVPHENKQLDLKRMDTNQPVNVITNIKSLVKYYKIEEKKFARIVYQNSLRAFKLLK